MTDIAVNMPLPNTAACPENKGAVPNDQTGSSSDSKVQFGEVLENALEGFKKGSEIAKKSVKDEPVRFSENANKEQSPDIFFVLAQSSSLPMDANLIPIELSARNKSIIPSIVSSGTIKDVIIPSTGNTITNPVTSGIQSGFNPQTGLIGNGMEVLPDPNFPLSNAPPGKPNAPPGLQTQPVTAGPRGEITEPNQPIRINEEAVDPKTQRAVSDDSTRNPNLLREYFRMPANEITRGNVNHPVNTEKIFMDTMNDAGKSTEAFAHIHKPSADTAKQERLPFQDIPKTASGNQEYSGKVQTEAHAGDKSPNGNHQNNAHDQSKVLNNVKVLSHSSGQSMKSSMENIDSSTMSNPSYNNVPGGQFIPNGASESQNIINVKTPVSVLGDAPSRISSEVGKAVNEQVADNGKIVLKVELTPPRLGRMNIEIVKSLEGVDVKLVLRTAFARELVAQRGEEIRSALTEMGINLKKFEVVEINQAKQDFSREQPHEFIQNSGYQKGGREYESGSADHTNMVSSNDDTDDTPGETPAEPIRSNPDSVTRLNILA